MKNKSVVIVCGDPESTFKEILIKTLKNKVLSDIKFPIIIICSKKLFQNEIKKYKAKVSFKNFENHNNLKKKNIVSAEIGPKTFIFFFFKIFIAGKI